MNETIKFDLISTFVFDVDGVLTDGTVLVLENGLQARRMSIRDGFALQLAAKLGYRVLIVSGSSPSPVVDRLQKLGITEIHMSVLDKKGLIEEYMRANALVREQVLFMGDDLPDEPAMSCVGISACPHDAAAEIKDIARYVSPANGGSGCVRDVIEKVLKTKGQWKLLSGVASR